MPFTPVRVFCAYSRRDKSYRDDLVAHLSGLQRNGVIDLWFDRYIQPGVDWNREISVRLDTAEIAILLLSADFFASEYCMGVEYQRALERAGLGDLRAVPVLIRKFHPLPPEVMKFQGLPSNGKPVKQWADRDQAFADIARGIEKVAQDVRQQKVRPSQSGSVSMVSRPVRFGDTDVLGWVRVPFLTLTRRKYSWQDASQTPMVLPNHLRMAVFGAFGTGRYGAPVLARTIMTDPRGYQLLLHLGDTYYCGTEDEIRQRLLALWPRVPGAISRALCGNHEMYSGGQPWFRAVTSEFSQKSSYFSFQNDSWILACLDTAYDDNDLHGCQIDWLQGLLDQRGGRQVVLFTHHHPISWFEPPGKKLLAKLTPILESAPSIVAWYWAHEHRCIVYDPHPIWRLSGRCIGHGGFPYRRLKLTESVRDAAEFVRMPGLEGTPGGEVLDGPNPYIPGHEQAYGPHGFVTLEFDGPHLTETMCQADGTALRQQRLT
jgi:hypothetical protein